MEYGWKEKRSGLGKREKTVRQPVLPGGTAKEIGGRSRKPDRESGVANGEEDAAREAREDAALRDRVEERLGYDGSALREKKRERTRDGILADVWQKEYDRTWDALMNVASDEERAYWQGRLDHWETRLGAGKKALDDAEAALKEEQRRANRAWETQTYAEGLARYDALARERDFGAYTGSTAEEIRAAEQEAQTALELAQWDALDDPGKEGAYEAAMEEHNALLTLADVADYLTPEERDIWNYLRSTRGTEAVREYIGFMEDTWNYRKGMATGEQLMEIENPVLQALAIGGYGMLANVESTGSGMRQMFSQEPLARTASQYGTRKVREELADVGGQFGGKSAGQWAYDLLPGKAVGSAMALFPYGGPVWGVLGTGGALGNAYRDARQGGYSVEDAWKYSIASGITGKVLNALMGQIGSKKSGEQAESVERGVMGALVDWAARTGKSEVKKKVQGKIEAGLRDAIGGDGAGFDILDDGEIYDIVMEILREEESEEKGCTGSGRYYDGWEE